MDEPVESGRADLRCLGCAELLAYLMAGRLLDDEWSLPQAAPEPSIAATTGRCSVETLP